MIKYKPHAYQEHSEKHILENPFCALFLEMGLGKTVTTLTAIRKMIYSGEAARILIIAPKRVAKDTWTDEVAKWEHLQGLRISVVLGNEKERKQALKAKADIYVINRENVVWLTAFYQSGFPFDCVVIDELSSFKSPKSLRFKALRRVLPSAKRVIGLTGTPAPNGLLDLWSQIYLLDRGERLGKTLGAYRLKYFEAFRKRGVPVDTYRIKKEEDDLIGEDITAKMIHNKISDICISMKSEDYLDLPERVDIVREVKLSDKIQEMYNNFEKEQVIAFMSEIGETEISVPNAAALVNKLLQFSNGAVYDAEKKYHEMHNEKIEALEEELEAANGQPVLVLYSFKHDVERIMRYCKSFKPVIFDDKSDILKKWNAGEIPVLLGHPASMGHGLNMQHGGNLMVHFGRNWSLELYDQVKARLHRQGQTKPVINTSLICPGTYEVNVIQALEAKDKVQSALMESVKALLGKYK